MIAAAVASPTLTIAAYDADRGALLVTWGGRRFAVRLDEQDGRPLINAHLASWRQLPADLVEALQADDVQDQLDAMVDADRADARRWAVYERPGVVA